MIEFKRTTFKFDVYGTQVELNAPTVEEYQMYEKELGNKDCDNFKLMCDFLCGLGMKIEVLKKMENSHLIKLLNIITRGDDEKK